MSSQLTCSECNRLTRQAHFIAAVLIWTGLALASTVSPGWIWMAALPGFGLILDALTGVCPMTALLAKMPWNGSRAPAQRA